MEAFQTIIATILFVVPGFISNEVANAITARKDFRREEKEKLAGLLVFACLNYGIFFLFERAFYIMSSKNWQPHLFPPHISLAWVIVIAIYTGFIWGGIKERYTRKFYDWIWGKDITGFQGDVTAWDQVFIRFGNHHWATVTTDKEVISGYIGGRSCYPEEPALFLERLPNSAIERKVGDEWEAMPIDALYIPGKDIKRLSFWTETYTNILKNSEEGAAFLPQEV